MSHLRYAGLSHQEQCAALLDIAQKDPLLQDALAIARSMQLPQWRIVSGAVYNTVWNHLTGKPSGYGVKDIDLFYYDARDISWKAEDTVIRRGSILFATLPVPVEIRNQARVHLWYREKFGEPFPALATGDESLGRFASKTHAVGLRLDADDQVDLYAPFGLDDVFSFRITPNRSTNNRKTHEKKGERAKRLWPEVSVEPW